MDNVEMILLIVIAAFAVIGLITGLAKGFTNVKSWGNEFVLTAVITIPLGNVVADITWGNSKSGPALTLGIVIAIAVVCLLILMLFSQCMRCNIASGIEKHKKYVSYQQHDDVADNEELILEAVYNQDKKSYKHYSEVKFKQSGGGWGVWNRILGAITLAVKSALTVSIAICVFLMMFDLCGLQIQGLELELLQTGVVWGFIKNYIFDFILIGVLMACIRCGFHSGISLALWSLVVIGLIAGAAYLSWHLVFNAGVFDNAAAAFNENCVEGWFGNLTSMGSLNFSTLNIAKWIITAGLFVLFLVVVILIAIFGPRFIEGARSGATFRIVDGIIGAICAAALVFAVLLFVGGILGTASELDFMQNFNTYFEKSGFARFFYTDNPLVALGAIPFDLAKYLS